MSATQKKTYDGLERKLVIAFDVGTTFSGVSYVLLIPGETITIQGVTRFPGQQKVGGDSKIPSVVCYDEEGNVAAVGPETDPDLNPEIWEMEGLIRAEWFKLHLRPPHLVAEQGFNVKDIPPLPPNKTVIEIMGDFLRYLYKSAVQYIREREGDSVFEFVDTNTNIDFVLGHPNGWEGKQQSEMRRAAVAAGFVKDMSDALKRVSFVTEGEASLHFCLKNVPNAVDEYANDGVLVLDCGGGTIDISTYARSSSGRFREIAATECLLQGSIFVTRRAQAYLTEKLQKSRYGTPEDVDIMAKYFDKTTKPSYKGSPKPHFIRFGRSENDPQFDIRNGGIKITEFFDPAVNSIIQVIEKQSRISSVPIKAVFMIGGFATSEYLFSKLEEHFKPRSINILRPDSYLKAVAEGAISYKLDHSVASRISRYTYGTECIRHYDPNDLEHIIRSHTRSTEPSGEIGVPGYFVVILEKDTEIFEEKEFRCSFIHEYTEEDFHQASRYLVDVKCYRGKKAKPPAWIDQDPDFFTDLCIVSADFSELKRSAQCRTNQINGKRYYCCSFDVIILFGLTELKAQIAWKENGVEKRGPASIIYDMVPETGF